MPGGSSLAQWNWQREEKMSSGSLNKGNKNLGMDLPDDPSVWESWTMQERLPAPLELFEASLAVNKVKDPLKVILVSPLLQKFLRKMFSSSGSIHSRASNVFWESSESQGTPKFYLKFRGVHKSLDTKLGFPVSM
jgi:hypothetical protein